MSAVLNLNLQFEVTYCCREGCGAPIALPSANMKMLRDSHARFYCCWGHCQCFTGDDEATQLRKELAAAAKRLEAQKAETDRQRERLEAAHKSVSAMKGQVTRIKNRVGNGVCPCCNRSFNNLQRHMHTKHPEYKNEGAKESE